jgi:hypothetical protein
MQVLTGVYAIPFKTTLRKELRFSSIVSLRHALTVHSRVPNVPRQLIPCQVTLYPIHHIILPTRSGQLPRVCLRQPLYCIVVLFNVAVISTFSFHS